MKLLTIIVDATGALHIEATRGPDLRRRDISQEAGGAEILFSVLRHRSGDPPISSLQRSRPSTEHSGPVIPMQFAYCDLACACETHAGAHGPQVPQVTAPENPVSAR